MQRYNTAKLNDSHILHGILLACEVQIGIIIESVYVDKEYRRNQDPKKRCIFVYLLRSEAQRYSHDQKGT